MSGGGNEVKSGSMTLSTTTGGGGGKTSSSSANQRSTGAESEVTAEQLNDLDQAVTVCQQRLSEARAARGAAEAELSTLQKRFKSIDSEVYIFPLLPLSSHCSKLHMTNTSQIF